MAATNPSMYPVSWDPNNPKTLKPLWPCICCWRNTEQCENIDKKIKKCWDTCLWTSLASFLCFIGFYAGFGQYKEMKWPKNKIFWPGMVLTGTLTVITHIVNSCINKLKTG